MTGGARLASVLVAMAGVAGCRATAAPPAPSPAPEASARTKAPARQSLEVRAVTCNIQPQRMAASIAHLVGFGTRHTLSDPTSPTRGIGAARTWIKAQLRDGWQSPATFAKALPR